MVGVFDSFENGKSTLRSQKQVCTSRKKKTKNDNTCQCEVEVHWDSWEISTPAQDQPQSAALDLHSRSTAPKTEEHLSSP